MSGRRLLSAKAKYGFNGKLKDNEDYGEGNAYDFGARIYDPRLGKWLSVDPLQTKYPGLSPYAFSFNSPLAFNDPDGKDGRLAVDNINRTITLETTINIYGAGAAGMANDLNKNFNKIAPGPRQFKDNDGNVWTVAIKVTYTEVNNKTLTAAATANNKNNVDVGRGSVMQADDVKGITPGDNILEIDGNKDWGVAGVAFQGASGGAIGAGASDKTYVHEPFHLLGYDERYKGAMSNEGFQNDVMKPGEGYAEELKVNAMHYTDIVDYVTNPDNKIGNGITILKNVKLDKTLSGTTPASKEEVKAAEAREVKK
jgi:RHS repeat-associated protein